MADKQTKKTPEIQVTVDELSNKIKETTNELNQLKNWLNNLSLEQKNDKLSDIENAILECSDDLAALEKDGSISIDKKKLNTLKSQIDTLTTSKEILKKQIEKQTDEALSELNKSVTQSENTEQNQENWEEEKSKKWWKTWLRIGWLWLAWWWLFRLWKRIFGRNYDYESEIPWYSSMPRRQRRLERKKLRQRKKAERRSDRSAERWEFRDRPFGRFVKWTGIFLWVWSGIYYLAHWIYTKNWWLNDLFDWKKGKKLKMEEALPVVEWEVNNWKTEESIFRNDFDWIKYDEESGMIKSYGQETKIDVKKRMVEWLNVKFSDLPELIHVANIINCLKHNLWWKSDAESPFSETSTWWDIQFKFSQRWANEVLGASNSNTWWTLLTAIGTAAWITAGGYVGWILGAILGWAWLWAGGAALWRSIDNDSTLGHACSTIASWENFKRFIWHLNGIKDADWKSIWTPREQKEASPSPMKQQADKAIARLKNYKKMDWKKDRALDIKQDQNDPNRYEISSFRDTAHIKIEWWKVDKDGNLDANSIQSITIEKYNKDDCWPKEGEWSGLKLPFPNNEEWLQECIRTIDLINEIRFNYQHQWEEKCSIHYRDASMTEWTWMLEKWLKIDTKWAWWETIRSKADLEKYYPTLLADLKKRKWKRSKTIRETIEEGKAWESSDFLCFLNWMVDKKWVNYFEK